LHKHILSNAILDVKVSRFHEILKPPELNISAPRASIQLIDTAEQSWRVVASTSYSCCSLARSSSVRHRPSTVGAILLTSSH